MTGASSRDEMVDRFRQRLESTIADAGLSRSAFARRIGIDRSTLSQLLSPENDRLPRAETLAAIATAQKVSVDWLIGLAQSQRGHLGADIIREQMSIERDALSPADARLIAWHAEAIGYKIRYVPLILPDLLKDAEVIRYELEQSAASTPEQAIETAAARLAYQRRPETDMEACSPVQAVEGFARGEGMWRDLPAGIRARQLDYMATLVEELYPTFRWFLFDGRTLTSAPVTVFGPLRAALYVGQMYFVFTSVEHIRVLTAHFDALIRRAIVQPTEIPALLRRLRAELG